MERYDVIVVGGGIAGSTMGAVLAKHGYEVAVLERGTHPRFAIGESMLPQSSMWMWITAEHFGLPELKHLTRSEHITEHISRACGIKRSIAFAYHQPGRTADPRQTQQFIAPELPLTSESHLFREDIDRYMWLVAQQYGADCRENTTVNDVTITAEGVTVALASGDTLQAAYIVDASGRGSPVANTFGCRDEVPHARTRSRAIFTHAHGLFPYDDLLNGTTPGFAYRMHDGTLHHVFDGGWLWIIPFDNHSRSTNGLASIGLMLDIDSYPTTGKHPEHEFWEIIRQFPSIAAHMEHLDPVREWIGTDRLQYTASSAVGERYMLLNHAHSFIDPLYSRGLISTFETVHAAAALLLEALDANDFSAERFAYMNHLQTHLTASTDQMISNAYRAMRHFETWNAWTQLWVATKLFGDIWLFRHCLNYLNSGDTGILRGLLDYGEASAVGAPHRDELQTLVDQTEHWLDQVEAGVLTPSDAADHIYQTMHATETLPKHIYGWGSEAATHGDFNAKVPDLIMWGKTAVPAHIRTGLFDFDLPA